MNNYSKVMTFDASTDKVYDALTSKIPKWWTEQFEGTSNRQGENFTIRFGTNIFKTMKVTELSPGKKVVWNVIDSLIDLPELNNKSEWVGTKIEWVISQKENQTQLNLTHYGLTPQIECYTICEGGWEQFTYSLSEFINTGIGRPYIAVTEN